MEFKKILKNVWYYGPLWLFDWLILIILMLMLWLAENTGCGRRRMI